MERYLVIVKTHDGTEHRYSVVTSEGPLKAAYMAGSAYNHEHPRTGVARFTLEPAEQLSRRRVGEDDLVDRMEW